MKQINAILKDDSKQHFRLVSDDFDIGNWSEKMRNNFDLLGIKEIVVEDVNVGVIYMIQNSTDPKGLWTSLDKMLEWVNERVSLSCGKFDLKFFMGRHQVVMFKDGGGKGEWLDWEDIIP